MATRKAVRCPGCGLFIVMDDAACEMLHENPICATFQTIARLSGMKPRHDPWVVVVAADGSVKKPVDA